MSYKLHDSLQINVVRNMKIIFRITNYYLKVATSEFYNFQELIF